MGGDIELRFARKLNPRSISDAKEKKDILLGFLVRLFEDRSMRERGPSAVHLQKKAA